MNLDTLKVISVNPIKTDKRGREYQTVKFQKLGIVSVGNSSVLVPSDLTGTRNFYKDFTDADGKFWAGDAHFGNLTIGSIIMGSIVSANTTAYKINDKEVTRYKAVLLEKDMTDVTSALNTLLKPLGACVVDEFGTATKPENLKQVSDPNLVAEA